MSLLARLGLRATGLSAALLLGLAAPAVAVDGASIAHVETTGTALKVLVSVPDGADVDLAAVTASVDGVDAPATAALATTTDEVRRTAVLAIDTSNSMRGERFSAARAAAEVFLDTVPDDVYVGIVSFAADVTTDLAPTLDRDQARATLDTLALSRQTRLYDGVRQAVDVAGAEGQRTIVVLSDGADTSDTPLQDVISTVTDADVLVDAVSLDTGGAVTPLRRLARAGKGDVVRADPSALRAAFSREADVLARQVLVTLDIPETVTAREATLSVTLPTADELLVASAFATVRDGAAPAAGPAAPAAPATEADPLLAMPPWAVYAGIGAVGLGLLVVLVLLVPSAGPPMTPAERVATYTDRLGSRGSPGSHKGETEQAIAQATEAAAQVLRRNKSLEDRIARRLDGAGSELKPAEWLLVHAGVFVGAGLLGLLLGAGSLVVGFLFLLLGIFGPWLYLGLRRSRRQKAFSSALPDTLQLMSGSLAAGLSLAQSVDTIVREGVEPIASEFKRVLVEARLGVALEDALEGVAERFDSKDFEWVVMAIRIQRQVGGNLAELLNTVAATMREREYMRRQVAALAAEGKLSAWVLGGLPPAFLLYLMVSNRDYVMVLFTNPIGWLMLLAAGTLLGVGVFWMSRLVRVEV